VEKEEKWLLGVKKLMFSPFGATSTAPLLTINASVSPENWHGWATWIVFHPPGTNMTYEQISRLIIEKWPAS
jgi:hypothetical protein